MVDYCLIHVFGIADSYEIYDKRSKDFGNYIIEQPGFLLNLLYNSELTPGMTLENASLVIKKSIDAGRR